MNVSIVFLMILPVLLVVSALASGSETALFTLTREDRALLKRVAPASSNAIEALLASPRRLLILVLLVNMLANVSYFVVSSVVASGMDSAAASAAVGVAAVFTVTLLGEVLAKLVARAIRVGFCRVLGPAMGLVNTLAMPIVLFVENTIVNPVHRLTGGDHAGSGVGSKELSQLLLDAEVAADLAPSEGRLLREVLELREIKAADVMTPRVDVKAVRPDSSRADVLRLVGSTRSTRVPVVKPGPGRGVVGVLDVKRYLADPLGTVSRWTVPAVYVPETGRIDAVLGAMRSSRASSAICVDEHGAFTGLVQIEDIVDELLAGLGEDEPTESQRVELIGLGRWLVPGDLSLRDAAPLIGPAWQARKDVSTVAGAIMATLGRVPRPGESIRLGDAVLTAERVTRRRIQRVRVESAPAPASEGEPS